MKETHILKWEQENKDMSKLLCILKQRNVFIILITIGFLSSCLNTKKGADRLYEYDYCIAVSERKSEIISQNDTLSTGNNLNISGKVIDLKFKEPVWGSIVKLTTVNSETEKIQITDSVGRFHFSVPKKKYQLSVKFVGYTTFQTECLDNKNSMFEIGLGEASAFVDYVIKSKRKLTNQQLKQMAIKMTKEK